MKTVFSWLGAIMIATAMATPARAVILDRLPLKVQSYQVRELGVCKEDAFNSSLTVLQDLGCIIDYAEIRTGFISARSPLLTGRFVRMNVFVTDTKHGKAKVRLTAFRCTGKLFDHSEVPIANSGLYERFFARVQEAIFIDRHVRFN
jgi:hypothetical protein